MRRLLALILYPLFPPLCLPLYAGNILDPVLAQKVFEDKPRLVVLWSLDCPPCFKELALLEQILVKQPNFPVTLISTDDDVARHAEVERVYSQIHGKNLKKWIFAEMQSDRLRYIIDPQWYGELPRSYFIDTNTNKVGHSGLLKEKDIMAWFDKITGNQHIIDP